MEENIDFGKIFNAAEKNLGRANIIVTGKTGVGKSTLINAVFQEPLAEVGEGRPVTDGIKEYTKDGFPVSLIDTMGLELNNYKTIVSALKDEIKRRNGADPQTHIHLCWYCIANTSKRIEDCEVEFIKELSESVKVVVILTRCIDDDLNFYNYIKKELYNYICSQPVRVLAMPYSTPIGIIPSFGLDKLVSLTEELLPDAQKRAFAAAQKVNLELKKKKAHKIVGSAATAAAAAGAVPIPFSDAAVLAPIQVGMIASISFTFGLAFDKAFLSTLVASAAGVVGASYAGRAIVSGLLKLIPVVGSITGGVISAATAAALTTVLGETYIKSICILFEEGETITAANLSATWVTTIKSSKF